MSAKLRLAEDREKGYFEALNGEKKRRKRGQPFTEELRVDEGIGALFFSPSKIRRARELQDAKEAAKEREALEKVSRAETRAAAKVQKELEAQRKREERAARAEARKAEHALKEAQREQAREAKNARKQLQIESAARRKRHRGRPAKQKSSSTAASTTVAEEMMPIRSRSRRGRTIKIPARFKEN